MNNQELNKIIAVTFIAGTTTVVAAMTVSFIEQIRKDRASRKANEGFIELTKKAQGLFTNLEFERIIKENDL